MCRRAAIPMLMTEKTKRATANGPGAPQQKGDTAMATTSSNLVAGKVIAGQGGKGKGYKGRAAGLVASAALGLSLLTGVVFSQARQETPVHAQVAAPAAQLSPAA